MNSDSITWKTIGRELGWLGIVLCLLDIFSQVITEVVPIEFIVVALNLLVCGLWLFGIAKNKTACMLSSLIAWGIEMMMTFIFIIFKTNEIMMPNESSNFVLLTTCGSIVFVLAYFALGVISFKKIREEIQRPAILQTAIIPRWNVTHQQRQRIKVKKYINLLNDENCDKV